MKTTKLNFASIANNLGYEVEAEFKFCKDRKFRADWKVSKDKKSCLIEYEGVRKFYGKQYNGHTDLPGYTSNCEKYNLAQLEGWIILRYTCKNIEDVWRDLDIFFNKFS